MCTCSADVYRTAAAVAPHHATALEVSRQYMDLSSAHQLPAVFSLFREESSYHSDSLGASYQGLPQIREMMVPFFQKFPDITWETTR